MAKASRRRAFARVVMMIVRLHLVLAVRTACAVLAFNPAFVIAWVGGRVLRRPCAERSGWRPGIVASSLVHALVTTASVLGNRLKVGAATIANGIVQTALAFLFGAWWSLGGIAAALRHRRTGDVGPDWSGAPQSIDRAVDPHLLAGAALALAAADCAGRGRLRALSAS